MNTLGMVRLAALAFSALPILVVNDVHAQSRGITIEKEVVIAAVKGAPAAVIAAPNNALVVAGTSAASLGSAWAVAVDAQGHLLWRYDESGDPAFPRSRVSGFKGVVSLSTGNLLFCGSEETASGRAGLVVILDSHGKLVAKQTFVPSRHPEIFSSGIYQCVRWGTGIGLFGTAITPDFKGGGLWFAKVDDIGRTVQDALIPELRGASAAAVGPAGATLVQTSSGKEVVQVYRVDSNLTVLKRGSISGHAISIINVATDRQDANKIIVYRSGLLPKVYSIDDDLHMSEFVGPRDERFTAEGGGYRLEDRSFALFGYTQELGGALTAAIALMDVSGHVKSKYKYIPENASFTVRGAASLGNDRFATVRNVIARSAVEAGLAITWISVK